MKIVYNISANHYLTRAIINVARFTREEDIKFAFYAALELRNCIERVLFEYMWMLKESGLSKNDINSYKPDDFICKIEKFEPYFEQKIKFTEEVLKTVIGPEFNIALPDFNRLNKLYGKLGNYLHAAKTPENQSAKIEWYENLTHIVIDAKEYLVEILSSNRARIKEFTPEAMDLYHRYRNSYPNIEQDLLNEIAILFAPLPSNPQNPE